MTTTLVHADCLEWFSSVEPDSVHAVVTDPPFSVEDFESGEVAKLRSGEGGVWRQPPMLDGHRRRPVPRFTVLSTTEQQRAMDFFARWAALVMRVLRPGGHVIVATTPILSHLVYMPLLAQGFEKRAEIVRLVQTLRGGDRPKNAEQDFPDVTVMPRGAWEPWGVFRKPFNGTVAECLRRWETGALRRESADRPLTDVVKSGLTPSRERSLAPHPCLKPQAFARFIVRAALPLGRGHIVDPFMGGGAIVAAAQALDVDVVGVEIDEVFFRLAEAAVPKLAKLPSHDADS